MPLSVCHLEVRRWALRKKYSLGHGDVAERLEDHHCDRLPGKSVAGNHLRDDIQTGGEARDSCNNTNGDCVHRRQEKGDEEHPYGQARAVFLDRGQPKSHRNQEDSTVPPLRHFGVASHESCMNIWLFRQCALVLLYTVLTVEENRMHKGGSDGTKAKHVRQHKVGRQVLLRVLIVLVHIQLEPLIDDGRDLIWLAESIVNT